jgi:hypothetical protein
MTARRFPPPWTVEELDACFIVKDSNEQALGYVYYEVRATYLSYAARKPQHLRKILRAGTSTSSG